MIAGRQSLYHRHEGCVHHVKCTIHDRPCHRIQLCTCLSGSSYVHQKEGDYMLHQATWLSFTLSKSKITQWQQSPILVHGSQKEWPNMLLVSTWALKTSAIKEWYEGKKAMYYYQRQHPSVYICMVVGVGISLVTKKRRGKSDKCLLGKEQPSSLHKSGSEQQWQHTSATTMISTCLVLEWYMRIRVVSNNDGMLGSLAMLTTWWCVTWVYTKARLHYQIAKGQEYVYWGCAV